MRSSTSSCTPWEKSTQNPSKRAKVESADLHYVFHPELRFGSTRSVSLASLAQADYVLSIQRIRGINHESAWGGSGYRPRDSPFCAGWEGGSGYFLRLRR